MKYRLITLERIWNDPNKTKDYNICLQQKYYFWWKTIAEYRPYQFQQAIDDLDFQRRLNNV